MTPVLVFSILFFGILLFVAEVFLFPSGILGKVGLITTVVGLFFAYKIFGFNTGTLCLSLTVACCILVRIEYRKVKWLCNKQVMEK